MLLRGTSDQYAGVPHRLHICLLWRDTVSAGRRHTNDTNVSPLLADLFLYL